MFLVLVIYMFTIIYFFLQKAENNRFKESELAKVL